MDIFAHDFEWLSVLTTKMKTIKPTSLEAAIGGLSSLDIDVDKLRDVLGAQRQKWESEKFLQNHGIPNEYMDLALLLHSYTLQDPPINQIVSTTLNNPEVKNDDELLAAVLPWVSGVDMALCMLPEKFSYDGEAFRGIPFHLGLGEEEEEEEEEDSKIVKGKLLCWHRAQSFATDPTVMMQSGKGCLGCGTTGDRTIMKVQNFKGKRIDVFSAYPRQFEILGRIGSHLRVSSDPTKQLEEDKDGDPFETADIVECMMESTGVPEGALFEFVREAVSRRLEKNGVPRSPIDAIDALKDSKCLLSVNGPTKAGKSTLVNGLLGQLAAPCGEFPCTVIPMILYHFGHDQEEGKSPRYILRVRGTGIESVLRGIENFYEFPSAEGLFNKVIEINDSLRSRLQSSQDEYESADWHFQVELPGKATDLAICDCGGGSEGGTLGQVISTTLTYRVKTCSACLLLIDVAHIGSLTKEGQLESWFGPRLPDGKRLILAVNKIDNEAAKETANELLDSFHTAKILKERFPAQNRYFTNAKVLLSKALLDKFGGEFPMPGSDSFQGPEATKILDMWRSGMKRKEHGYNKIRSSVLTTLVEEINDEYNESFSTWTFKSDIYALVSEFPTMLVRQAVSVASRKASEEWSRANTAAIAAARPVEEVEPRIKELEALDYDEAEGFIKTAIIEGFSSGEHAKRLQGFARRIGDALSDEIFLLLGKESRKRDDTIMGWRLGGLPTFANNFHREALGMIRVLSPDAWSKILTGYSVDVKDDLSPFAPDIALKAAQEWMKRLPSTSSLIVADVQAGSVVSELHMPELASVSVLERFVTYPTMAFLEMGKTCRSNIIWTGQEAGLTSLTENHLTEFNIKIVAEVAGMFANGARKNIGDVVAAEIQGLRSNAAGQGPAARRMEAAWKETEKDLQTFASLV